MNKERYNQIVDEIYKNYLEKYKQDKTPGIVYYTDPLQLRPYTEEEFINKIKTGKKFSERWELEIEERELSNDERIILMNKKLGVTDTLPQYYNTDDEMDKNNIPTKVITVTYNNETIEIYE
jgi:ASC-1-like (ASCH) protein